ncbi:hypothetical protein G6F40_013108 [Rhizopus arrhizus]|nr:hypothetical protein G6F40_013108 [Rhizopus arrhizus]
MLALSAPMLVLPMLAARWAERIGSARLCTLGLLVCATGLYLLSRHASHPSPSQWVPLLMLIGAGTALPWGLMDGLSVSVVPVQRAGMAAGIFGTVRVAGEGIALAAVTALLALLIGQRLQGASPASLARAGAYLATGAHAQAQALLPAMRGAHLQQASAEALAILLRVLALLTAASDGAGDHPRVAGEAVTEGAARCVVALVGEIGDVQRHRPVGHLHFHQGIGQRVAGSDAAPAIAQRHGVADMAHAQAQAQACAVVQREALRDPGRGQVLRGVVEALAHFQCEVAAADFGLVARNGGGERQLVGELELALQLHTLGADLPGLHHVQHVVRVVGLPVGFGDAVRGQRQQQVARGSWPATGRNDSL